MFEIILHRTNYFQTNKKMENELKEALQLLEIAEQSNTQNKTSIYELVHDILNTIMISYMKSLNKQNSYIIMALQKDIVMKLEDRSKINAVVEQNPKKRKKEGNDIEIDGVSDIRSFFIEKSSATTRKLNLQELGLAIDWLNRNKCNKKVKVSLYNSSYEADLIQYRKENDTSDEEAKSRVLDIDRDDIYIILLLRKNSITGYLVFYVNKIKDTGLVLISLEEINTKSILTVDIDVMMLPFMAYIMSYTVENSIIIYSNDTIRYVQSRDIGRNEKFNMKVYTKKWNWIYFTQDNLLKYLDVKVEVEEKNGFSFTFKTTDDDESSDDEFSDDEKTNQHGNRVTVTIASDDESSDDELGDEKKNESSDKVIVTIPLDDKKQDEFINKDGFTFTSQKNVNSLLELNYTGKKDVEIFLKGLTYTPYQFFTKRSNSEAIKTFNRKQDNLIDCNRSTQRFGRKYQLVKKKIQPIIDIINTRLNRCLSFEGTKKRSKYSFDLVLYDSSFKENFLKTLNENVVFGCFDNDLSSSADKGESVIVMATPDNDKSNVVSYLIFSFKELQELKIKTIHIDFSCTDAYFRRKGLSVLLRLIPIWFAIEFNKKTQNLYDTFQFITSQTVVQGSESLLINKFGFTKPTINMIKNMKLTDDEKDIIFNSAYILGNIDQPFREGSEITIRDLIYTRLRSMDASNTFLYFEDKKSMDKINQVINKINECKL